MNGPATILVTLLIGVPVLVLLVRVDAWLDHRRGWEEARAWERAQRAMRGDHDR